MERIGRQKLPKGKFEAEGNRITLRAASYNRRGSDSSKLTIFMPGWKVDGNSRIVARIGKSLARECNAQVVTISSHSKNLTSKSPQQEAAAVQQYLAKLHLPATNVLIAAHSLRTGEAMWLARQMEQTTGPAVDGVVAVSPIELTPFTGTELAKKIAEAAFYRIPEGTIRGILQGDGDVRRFIDAGFVGATMIGHIVRDTIRRGPRGHLRHIQRQIENTSAPVPTDVKAPVVVMLGEQDNVIPLQQAIQKTGQIFPTASVVVHRTFGHHGMPYQEYKRLAVRAVAAIERKKRAEMRG